MLMLALSSKHIINRMYLCNYKVYLNNQGIVIKGTLDIFVQMCKCGYIYVTVSELAHNISERFYFSLKTSYSLRKNILEE